jgi:hypothetical protein
MAAEKTEAVTSLRKANEYGSTYSKPTFIATKEVPHRTPEKAIKPRGTRILVFKLVA